MSFLAFLISLFIIHFVHSANILTIIPFPSYSHQQPILSVSIELARRGHNLTVITANPPKEKIPNFKVIDISSAYKFLAEYEKRSQFTFQKEWNSFVYLPVVGPCLEAVCDYELSLPQVQEFIRNANRTEYNIVILEDTVNLSFGGLVHKIGSPPVVGIQTLPPWSVTDWSMGVTVNPSFIPDQFMGHSDNMDFFERVVNTIFYWWTFYQIETNFIPRQERVLRKHFGDEPPSAKEFYYNKSFTLKSTDMSVIYPQPMPPNVIQMGPLHIKNSNPLPKDLKEWFDGAEDGVVYFSLGSNMKGTSLKEEKREAFVKAFAKFPKVRFIWKWESDLKIPGLSDNVMTRKWFPQQDIFGHPKLRLFIFQGGLQSTEETIYHGVPVLGIPLFGDQKYNVGKLLKEKAGLRLEMHEINVESLYEALNKLLYDETYKKNALRLSRIARDRMIPALDTAVWWIEYVIRHNGARHLRVASLDLPSYQLALIDVYAFLILSVLIIFYALYVTGKSIFSVLFKNGKVKTK